MEILRSFSFHGINIRLDNLKYLSHRVENDGSEDENKLAHLQMSFCGRV